MDDRFLQQVEALAAAGHAKELDYDSVVARVAVDQFNTIATPSPLDIARFVKIMLDSLDKTDEAAAARIAEALAPNPRAPAPVLARLMAIGPQAAAPVLRRAPQLRRATLLSRAESGACCEAQAVAARPDLDHQIVAALARRLERDVLCALAANQNVRIERGALLVLAQRGRLDLELGRALLARADMDADALPLFLSADGAMRRRLMTEAQRDALATPGAAAPLLSLARGAALAAAAVHDRHGFSTAIAQQLRTSRSAIDRLIDDDGGEALGLVLAAMGTPAPSGADAVCALRPNLADASGRLPDGVRLALDMNPAAANRIVAAIVSGRVLAPRPALSGEYGQPAADASAARETGMLETGVHKTGSQGAEALAATKVSRG